MTNGLEWIDSENYSEASCPGVECRVTKSGHWSVMRTDKPPVEGYALTREGGKRKCEEALAVVSAKSVASLTREFILAADIEASAPINIYDRPRTSGENVLLEADKIAGESRSRDYGHPKPNHDNIATVWNALFVVWGLKATLTASQVAQMMIGLKMVRHANARKFDNVLDAAGYVKCWAMIEEAEAANRNGINGPSLVAAE